MPLVDKCTTHSTDPTESINARTSRPCRTRFGIPAKNARAAFFIRACWRRADKKAAWPSPHQLGCDDLLEYRSTEAEELLNVE